MTEHRGFTLIELLIVVALIGIIAAIGVPFLLEAKSAANESSAIGSLRAVNSGQAAYSAACGRNAYAGAMATLINGRFVTEDMGFNPKSGYNFALVPGLNSAAGPNDCSGLPTESNYYASAVPAAPNQGRRGFATNATAVIWQDTTGVAPAEPFAAAGTVSPIQ